MKTLDMKMAVRDTGTVSGFNYAFARITLDKLIEYQDADVFDPSFGIGAYREERSDQRVAAHSLCEMLALMLFPLSDGEFSDFAMNDQAIMQFIHVCSEILKTFE